MRYHDTDGTSLVEVLVATAVVAGMFAAVFSGIHSGFKGTRRLDEESYAANRAVSLLEALASLPYDEIPDIPADTAEGDLLLPGLLGSVAEFTAIWGTANIDATFPRTVEVEEISVRTLDPAGAGNSQWGALKRIRVEVAWEPSYLTDTPPTKRLAFETLVTERGE